MTSNYSFASEDDDFFKSLDQSLTTQLSSVMLPNFISDLIEAINNLEDNTGDGFIFYEDDEYTTSIHECFTYPSCETDECDHQQRFLYEKDNEKITENGIDDGMDNVSEDMFAEFQDDQEIGESERVDQMSINEHENEEFPQEHMSVTLCDISMVSSVQNVEVVEECPKSASIQHAENQILRQASTSEDSPIVGNVDNEKLDECSDMVVCIPSIISDTSTYCEQYENLRDLNVKSPTTYQGAEQPAILNTDINEPPHERRKSVERMSSTECLGLSRFFTPINPAFNSPSRGSLSEASILQGFSPETIKRSEILEQQRNQYLSKTHNNIESDLYSTAQQPTIVNTDMIGSPPERTKLVERMPSTLGLSRFFTPINPALNLPSRGSPSGALILQEFSPERIKRSDVLEQQRMHSTECLGLSRFFTPINPALNSPSRGSLSGASILQGFSPETIKRSAVLEQQRNQNLSKTQNNVESDLNSTICEEYETTRNTVPEINMTEVYDFFDLDEAYTQCFVRSQNQNENSNAARRQIFIDEIEKLTLRLSNDLVCGRQLEIPVAYTLTWDNCEFNNQRLSLKPLGNGKIRNIRSNRKIAIIMYVLSFVYKLLISNATCTKREIYYSYPEFTQTQYSIDNAVNDVCLILNARPWEIGIFSSSKGLIAGSIKLTLNDDSIIDVENIDGGISLPHLTTTIKKVETTAKFVLLVEKHTVYEKLLTQNILIRLNPCILITGKGYPDINTRSILKKIWDDCKCPIYALVDAGPHGIEIMLTYRHGSLRMSHCNDDLAIPSIRWIGVYPSEIKSLRLQREPLTKEDIRRLDGMIKRPYISKKVYEELLVLKEFLHKTEVEGLTSGGINDWIKSYLLNKIEKGVFL